MTAIEIVQPDDWHLHLRDGEMLSAVLPYTASQFRRAIIMPNLVPPVVTTADAIAYRKRIIGSLPDGAEFEPLMTAYLTDNTDADDIAAGQGEGVLTAVKMYPANATTNSAHGVTDWRKPRSVLERMEKIGLPLLIHGEVTDPGIDIFDREAVFIEQVLTPMMADHPGLKIVLEHITTADGAEFVAEGPDNLGATITPHHLAINRNAIFEGGIRPHMYCLPIAKRARHQSALRVAATSGDPGFFLGTDSAPHPVHAKETACGCAGIFNAPSALAVYAQVFEEEGALERLEAFCSLNGPRFYGLAPNTGKIRLEKSSATLPETIRVAGTGDEIVTFFGGNELPWKVIP